jgi:hypothetical protein
MTIFLLEILVSQSMTRIIEVMMTMFALVMAVFVLVMPIY